MNRLASAVAFAALAHLPGPAAGQPPHRVLVMPFENVTRENRIIWLGEASAIVLADDLNALGASAITRDERLAAFDRLQVPPSASLTEATVIRIGQLVGASQVVVGALRLEGDTLVVQVRNIALDVGRIQHNITERGPVPELFATFERIARRLAPPSARTTQEIESAHPPLAAFEQYVKGLLAETPATAISYLNAALQLHPAFARPRLALWDVYTEQGEHARALAAVTLVPPQARWSRRARFLAGLSQLQLTQYDEAHATFSALADEQPSAAVFNNLGVVQLRRGASSQGRATYFFNRAAEADATDADYHFNLGYAYWTERDAQAAIHWLREAVRRNPADGDAHYVLAAALQAQGQGTEAARERELARRLSSTYEEWDKRPAAGLVPRNLERVKHDVEAPIGSGAVATLASSGQRNQLELARFYLERGERLYRQENDREALAELNRAIFLAPYHPEAHLLIGRIHLRGHRLAEAVDALKISLWSAETAEAHIVLGTALLELKDADGARGEAQRALALAPASVEARQLLERAASAPPQ